jgi:glycosyltransferase involved in cell wall biosynthesis
LGYRGRAVVTYFGPATNPPWTLEGWRARAYDRLYRASARRAACVLTAAGRMKQRVVETYGVPEARVEVIPLAPDPAFTPVADAERLGRVRRSCGVGNGAYVLFVGKLSGRHCIPQLVEAFGRARRGAEGLLRLLLVGPNVLGLDIVASARGCGVADSVVHIAHVSEEDLPALYSGAEAFVFPTTEAEGFGLPLVEAMACGTPVVSTALGSVAEVAGEAALLAPSNDVEALAGVLERVLRDQGLRADLRRRGLERARSFSWRTTAARTMEVLERVAKVPPVKA